MKAVERLKLDGKLTITKRYTDGTSEVVLDENNLIVTAAKSALLAYLTTPGLNSDPVASFKVGSGGTLDPGGLYPKTPSPTQTDIVGPQVLSSTNIVSTPGPSVPYSYVIFTFDILTSEANGQLISEVGLFKNSGALFSIKNFAAIAKTESFAIHFEWKIRIADAGEVSNRIITNPAKAEILSYLYTNRTSNPITRVQIGSDGTIEDPETLQIVPRMLSGNETSLFDTTPVIDSTVITFGAPDSQSISVIYDVQQNQAVGENLNEICLRKGDDAMFSIATFPTVAKTNAFSLRFEWVFRIG